MTLFSSRVKTSDPFDDTIETPEMEETGAEVAWKHVWRMMMSSILGTGEYLSRYRTMQRSLTSKCDLNRAGTPRLRWDKFLLWIERGLVFLFLSNPWLEIWPCCLAGYWIFGWICGRQNSRLPDTDYKQVRISNPNITALNFWNADLDQILSSNSRICDV